MLDITVFQDAPQPDGRPGWRPGTPRGRDGSMGLGEPCAEGGADGDVRPGRVLREGSRRPGAGRGSWLAQSRGIPVTDALYGDRCCHVCIVDAHVQRCLCPVVSVVRLSIGVWGGSLPPIDVGRAPCSLPCGRPFRPGRSRGGALKTGELHWGPDLGLDCIRDVRPLIATCAVFNYKCHS